MRIAPLLLLLLLVATAVEAAPGCLHVLKQIPEFCPKCSDPAAGGGTAGKKISAALCQSCGFYCWYTAAPDGGDYTFLPKASAPGEDAGCVPSAAERDRIVSEAIPLALHMQRTDFLQLAQDDPLAAAVVAMMLWRGDDASVIDAREFIVQFKGRPSHDDALALFDNYEERVSEPWSIPMEDDAFIHVEVSGNRTGDDHVQLAIRAIRISGASREAVGAPSILDVNVGDDEVPTSFAGQLVIAREALVTYPLSTARQRISGGTNAVDEDVGGVER